MFFLICNNDHLEEADTTKWLFANDSIMYMAMSGDADVTSFQQNLDRFAASEEKWMMKLHLQICSVPQVNIQTSTI